MKLLRILAIETSCDETAIALIEASGGLKNPHFKILENLVASQIKVHQPFGGVVPNLAKREHLKNLPILFKKIFNVRASAVQKLSSILRTSAVKNIDLIAVTVGPGLEPCLWTGINFAQEVYEDLRRLEHGSTRKRKIKLLGASHLEGHLYSFLLNSKSPKIKSKILFPAIALLVSGGHTILLLMNDLTRLKKLGETRDDAVGECFDKVARLLDLPYPGGPEIEKLSKKGNAKAINFPRPMLNQKNYDFSFSGLKTAVLYYLRKTYESTKKDENTKKKKQKMISLIDKADIAASFQEVAFETLIKKTLRAVKEFQARTIIVAGGVAANKTLAKMFKENIKKNKIKVNLIIPPLEFCTDNAAMIGVSAYFNFLQNKKYKLMANSNLNINSK